MTTLFQKITGKMGLAVGAALVLVLGLSLTAAHAAGGAKVLKKTLNLTTGTAQTLDLGRDVADVLVANPAVTDVGTLRANRLYIVGRALGNTNVLAFDPEGNPLADITVNVNIDEKVIKNTLRSFFPGENVKVQTMGTDVVLSGSVSTPATAGRVRDVASRFLTEEDQQLVDLMTVAGEQQVMLKVKIIEAKREILREYNISPTLNLAGINTTFTGVPGTGLSSLAPFGTGQIAVAPTSRNNLNATIQGMERDGLVSTLAEPALTAISGEQAGFLAGGEFPVPTGRDQDGNITLEFKKFGVSLNFIPTVLGDDNISLQLSTEVSARSDEDGVVLINTQIPGLTVRRADTTVQMASGGTLMIAGLIRSSDVHTLSGLPGIQDIPVLGELFRSKSFNRDESELLIVVTPYLVRPYAEKTAIEDTTVSANKPLRTAPPSLSEIGKELENLERKVEKVELQAPPPRTAAHKPTEVIRSETEEVVTEEIVADAEKVTRKEDPLTMSFVAGLQKTYGRRVPQLTAVGGQPGYMID